jgi:hypothetical protein
MGREAVTGGRGKREAEAGRSEAGTVVSLTSWSPHRAETPKGKGLTGRLDREPGIRREASRAPARGARLRSGEGSDSSRAGED